MRVFRRLLAAAVLLPLFLAAVLYFYLRTSLPQIAGSIAVHGITGTVTIARDADGVPLIAAANDDDAAFGLGFVHAQDRLFQMEMMRRYGAGRLSEVFGAKTLATDRQMRVLGIYRLAEAELPLLSEPVRRGLEAYAAGVNAFLATREGALQPEFLLLRFTPERWRPADTLVWGKLMDLLLAGNYRGELLRARLARSLSAADLAFLYPEYPKEAPTTLSVLLPIFDQLPLDDLYAALPPVVGPIYASNNWAVDGAHSGSGKPLVANDPHLQFAAPGVWYLARLKTPAGEIAGATAPGSPQIVIGHNAHIAWGFTNTESDVEDLFIEKLDPADPGRYLTSGGSEQFITREETIAVKDAAPLRLSVRATRHGPVLSDALPDGTAEQGFVLALAAPFLDEDDRTAEAVWGIDHARNWNDFTNAMRLWVGPQQNAVYGDIGGTIGFIAAARVPIRKQGNGWLPVPGWTGDNDWSGFIPFDKLPQATNPADGHFVSANNKIVPPSYPYFLSRDWDLPNRVTRIGELLTATPVQSLASSAANQADTLSIAARKLVPLMTRIAPTAEPSRGAVARLRRWDFRMDADKPEPLLFTAWLRAFARAVFTGHLGAIGEEIWDLKPQIIEAVLATHPEWCGPPQQKTASCDGLLAASLDSALTELSQAYGRDIDQWRWGRAHVAEFNNPVWSRISILRDWLDLAISTGGGFDTVNRGSTTLHDDRYPYHQQFGAGLRIITDLADPQGSQMIAVPGQSGNPLSPHFSDLLRRWGDFDYLLPGRAAAVATLMLEPAK